LGTGQINLGTGQFNLGTGQFNLGTGQFNLGTGQINLGTGQINLGTGQFNLETGQINLKTGQTNLKTLCMTSVFVLWATMLEVNTDTGSEGGLHISSHCSHKQKINDRCNMTLLLMNFHADVGKI